MASKKKMKKQLRLLQRKYSYLLEDLEGMDKSLFDYAYQSRLWQGRYEALLTVIKDHVEAEFFSKETV